MNDFYDVDVVLGTLGRFQSFCAVHSREDDWQGSLFTTAASALGLLES